MASTFFLSLTADECGKYVRAETIAAPAGAANGASVEASEGVDGVVGSGRSSRRKRRSIRRRPTNPATRVAFAFPPAFPLYVDSRSLIRGRGRGRESSDSKAGDEPTAVGKAFRGDLSTQMQLRKRLEESAVSFTNMALWHCLVNTDPTKQPSRETVGIFTGELWRNTWLYPTYELPPQILPLFSDGKFAGAWIYAACDLLVLNDVTSMHLWFNSIRKRLVERGVFVPLEADQLAPLCQTDAAVPSKVKDGGFVSLRRVDAATTFAVANGRWGVNVEVSMPGGMHMTVCCNLEYLFGHVRKEYEFADGSGRFGFNSHMIRLFDGSMYPAQCEFSEATLDALYDVAYLYDMFMPAARGGIWNAAAAFVVARSRPSFLESALKTDDFLRGFMYLIQMGKMTAPDGFEYRFDVITNRLAELRSFKDYLSG